MKKASINQDRVTITFRLRCQAVYLLLLICFGFSSGCVRERNPITGKSQAYGMSWHQELAMGQDANQQILQQYGLYQNPDLQAYVERVGQRVLAESDLRQPSTPAVYRQTPIKFQVLDSPVVNALAVPGYVYVTRGLLAHLENEAQLAVVLGHEIGHIAARHISEQALQEQWTQLGLVAGAIVGTTVLENPGMASQLLNLGGAAAQLVTRKYSRDDEREADRLGVSYAAAEGYKVAEAAAFFDTLGRLGARESVTLPSWLSTHPDPGEREETILRLARQYQPPGAIQAVGQDDLLRHLEGMVIGNNPREGFVKGHMFYHPELAFQFPVPQGWELKNERAAVVMAPPRQPALLTFNLFPGKNARQAAAEFVQQQQIQVLERSETSVNGFPAFMVLGQATTREGTVGTLNYFIESGDRVYHFLGLAAASQFSAVRDTFRRTMTAFSRLTDPRLLNVEPVRLAIVTADRTGPFASFLPTSQMAAGLSPRELAIMNQAQLTTTIPAGTKLKVPGTRLPR